MLQDGGSITTDCDLLNHLSDLGFDSVHPASQAFGSTHGLRSIWILPGCEPSQLWMVLQSDIECHLLAGADLAGLSTDLVRAFNNIPRQHSSALARHVGVPETLMRPWESFLGSCARAFEVHGWLSETTTSCSRLPEGDALSVYAMVKLCLAHLHEGILSQREGNELC